MNAVTPHPVYNRPNLPEKIGNDTWRIQFFKLLRPVYTKSSNYCDNANCSNSIRIGSPYHNYNDNDTEELYRWNHFQNDFFQNTDSQSE